MRAGAGSRSSSSPAPERSACTSRGTQVRSPSSRVTAEARSRAPHAKLPLRSRDRRSRPVACTNPFACEPSVSERRGGPVPSPSPRFTRSPSRRLAMPQLVGCGQAGRASGPGLTLLRPGVVYLAPSEVSRGAPQAFASLASRPQRECAGQRGDRWFAGNRLARARGSQGVADARSRSQRSSRPASRLRLRRCEGRARDGVRGRPSRR
jgi:hypothetical protein